MRDIGARAWESSARASRRCCSGSNLEPHRADDFGYWTDGILVSSGSSSQQTVTVTMMEREHFVHIHVVGNEIAIHPSRANYPEQVVRKPVSPYDTERRTLRTLAHRNWAPMSA
jgi:hypothetical protein